MAKKDKRVVFGAGENYPAVWAQVQLLENGDVWVLMRPAEMYNAENPAGVTLGARISVVSNYPLKTVGTMRGERDYKTYLGFLRLEYRIRPDSKSLPTSEGMGLREYAIQYSHRFTCDDVCAMAATMKKIAAWFSKAWNYNYDQEIACLLDMSKAVCGRIGYSVQKNGVMYERDCVTYFTRRDLEAALCDLIIKTGTMKAQYIGKPNLLEVE